MIDTSGEQTPPNGSSAAASELRDVARRHAFDSYTAALLAPKSVRDDIMVLAAFCGEAARIPFLVSEPMLGEIRLQWWRDWLDTRAARDSKTGNPLADALSDVIDRHGLGVARLKDLLEARADDAYAGCIESDEAFELYVAATTGVEFEMAAKILDVDVAAQSPNATASQFLRAATRATGIVDVCRRLPWHASRGRWPLPVPNAAVQHATNPAVFDPDRDIFDASAARVRDESHVLARNSARKAWDEARALSQTAGPAAVHAVLRTALVEPYLRALEAPGFQPLQASAEILPVTRMWRMWRAHRRQRF